MLAHLAGYWAIGLPVAWALGLSAALILIGSALVWVWRVRSRAFRG